MVILLNFRLSVIRFSTLWFPVIKFPVIRDSMFTGYNNWISNREKFVVSTYPGLERDFRSFGFVGLCHRFDRQRLNEAGHLIDWLFVARFLDVINAERLRDARRALSATFRFDLRGCWGCHALEALNTDLVGCCLFEVNIELQKSKLKLMFWKQTLSLQMLIHRKKAKRIKEMNK